MSRSSNARSLRRVLSLARRMNAQEEGRPEPTREPHAGWSRRHFMRVLAGTGAAAAAISATGNPMIPDKKRYLRIVTSPSK